MCTEQFAA